MISHIDGSERARTHWEPSRLSLILFSIFILLFQLLYVFLHPKDIKYMNTSTLTTPSPTSARYWATLKDLSNDVKLELISLLSTSMRNTEEDWTESFAGKWQDERSTEEITDDIRAARNAHMKEVEL